MSTLVEAILSTHNWLNIPIAWEQSSCDQHSLHSWWICNDGAMWALIVRFGKKNPGTMRAVLNELLADCPAVASVNSAFFPGAY